MNEKDPLTQVKLSKSKIGLIYPMSRIPASVSKNRVERVDAIMIHIHGGGFIATSSQTSSIFL